MFQLEVQALPRRRRRAAPRRSGEYECPECPSRFARRCDLRYVNSQILPFLIFKLPNQRGLDRKHSMRHTKPYGCTFPGCYKDFGSKGDWKRHEITQHFQQESYRCSLPRGRHAECARIFDEASAFVMHLQKTHQVQTDHNDLVIQHMISQNGQGQFWCGFCRRIVVLKGSLGMDAWKERFDHIDFEHINPRDGREPVRMNSWLPVSGHITRGVLQRWAQRRSTVYGPSSGNASQVKAEDEDRIECESCGEREGYGKAEGATYSNSSSSSSSSLTEGLLSPDLTQTFEQQAIFLTCVCFLSLNLFFLLSLYDVVSKILTRKNSANVLPILGIVILRSIVSLVTISFVRHVRSPQPVGALDQTVLYFRVLCMT